MFSSVLSVSEAQQYNLSPPSSHLHLIMENSDRHMLSSVLSVSEQWEYKLSPISLPTYILSRNSLLSVSEAQQYNLSPPSSHLHLIMEIQIGTCSAQSCLSPRHAKLPCANC
ncbi:hypothetical protein J6590_072680 [Homalodisca vitripennis]|nr:hypothetical protein J6590_072680 [Homalodisca vitripennis]